MSNTDWIGLLEGFPSSTNDGKSPIQCEHIPSLEHIQGKLDKCLVLSNSQYPREGALRAAAIFVRRMALRYGKEKAARILDEFFKINPVLVHIGEEGNDKATNGPEICTHATNLGSDEHVLGCPTNSEPGADDSDARRSDKGLGEGAQIFALPTRRQRDGISRKHVELELLEHEKDLRAFTSAYHSIHQRVLEVKDDGRLMALVKWSGTSAVMGSLELSIHAMERVIEELRDILKRMDAGAIINSDEG